jgi:hypothetical protein
MLWIMRQVLRQMLQLACRDGLAADRPTTKVWLRNLWMYGATERNQGTKVKLKTADMAGGRGVAAQNPIMGKEWARGIIPVPVSDLDSHRPS